VEELLGPLVIVHDPVPTDGLFAAKVAAEFEQIGCTVPATDVEGETVTVVVFDAGLAGVHPFELV
jgi:hypothetical protein